MSWFSEHYAINQKILILLEDENETVQTEVVEGFQNAKKFVIRNLELNFRSAGEAFDDVTTWRKCARGKPTFWDDANGKETILVIVLPEVHLSEKPSIQPAAAAFGESIKL